MELLLYYCIPRQDTNALAHRLIKRFGSFTGVLRAREQELMEVEGVGKSTAFFINLLMESVRHYHIESYHDLPEPEQFLSDIEACGKHLRPYFEKRYNERVYLLCLDAKCKVIDCKLVGEGSINSAAISIRRIVELALASNATSVVLAHNHPSGIATPSGEDVLTTRRLGIALNAVEICLVDHLIFAEAEYTSLRLTGLYMPNQHSVVV